MKHTSVKLKAAFAFLAAFACGAQAQTVFKCTAAGGAVTMQQTPCSASSVSSVSSSTIQTGRQATARPVESPSPRGADAGAPEPRRHWIVWTNDPRRDAGLAVANLEAIRLLGQGCEAQLRARGDNMADCRRFLGQLAPGGDFGRIGDKLSALMADPSAAQQVNPFEFRRAQGVAADIGRMKDFILVALQQR